jgi:hypothetical protein
VKEPLMFTVEVYFGETTRLIAPSEDYIRDEIDAFTKRLLKFQTTGPAPKVVVNHCTHLPFSEKSSG